MSSERSSSELRLSDTLSGRYVIEREIGSGGMGTVYLARDLKHDRSVAIKVLRPELSSSVAADRFLREVQIVAGLAHPHVVPLHDSDNIDGVLFYVMPYVDGESLRDLLAREGPLDPRLALEITRNVADGLAYAHGRGLVHRDIKPGNILMAGHTALVADFGVARAAEVAVTQAVTLPGTAIGTPSYMSPEQFSESGQADARSDIYSLGCVLYEMLAGKPPFTGQTAAAVLAGHVQGEVPPLGDTRDDLPPGVAELVARMLEKSPEHRFQSAEELTSALSGSASGLASPRWKAYAPAMMGAFALGATMLWGLSRFTGPPPLNLEEGAEAFVVLPFATPFASEEERDLLTDLTDELTRQLNRWETVRAVPSISLTGAMFDLGIAGPIQRAEDAFRIAGMVDANRVVALEVRLRGDSATLTATLQDVPTRKVVGRPLESAGLAADPFALTAAVAHEMLGLEGSVEEVEELRRQSSNPQALRAYREARQQLGASRLAEAEAGFREAVALDSTFTMANHSLALTLYWRASLEEGTGRYRLLGPEIGTLALRAVQAASDLSYRDSLHVTGFYRFQEGDYEEARGAYEALLARDPTDVYAWLLLGIVEFRDPWLVSPIEGVLHPRANWNQAHRAVGEAVRLSPGFHLGYGHLFDITREVLSTADRGGGPGFELPRDELITPWELRTPRFLRAFYPVFGDSIEWLDRDDFDSRPPAIIAEGADRLLDRSLGVLRRWAAFAPTESRPQDELSRWAATRRERLVGSPETEAAADLAVEALQRGLGALALRADTTAADQIRIAGLHLGAGDAEAALAVTRRALPRLAEGDFIDNGATNVFMAVGAPVGAIDLLALQRRTDRYWADSTTGELFHDGRSAPLVARLQILGATGVGGSRLHDAFEDLDAVWSPAEYTDWQLSFLHRRFAAAIAPALSTDELARAAWLSDLDDPLWQLATSAPRATADAIEAVRRYESPYASASTLARLFVLGRIAQDARLDRVAVDILEELDRSVLSIDSRDPGWGLRPLSWILRADSHVRLDEFERARALYRRVLATWTEDDPMTASRRAGVTESLARLPTGA